MAFEPGSALRSARAEGILGWAALARDETPEEQE